MATKKFAVILSGCGVFDGSEIHEATLTLLAISKLGCEYEMFAPDMEQHHVINHLSGEVMNEKRNVLVEAARIARGNIMPLQKLNMSNFDALIIPGGYGAAKNLSTFAFDGENMKVLPELEKVILDAAKQGKVIGALCIAPAILAKVLGNVALTIGNDINVAKTLEKFGANHVNTSHTEVAIDTENKIVTTPCYMLDSSIAQIYEGIENAIRTMLKLMI
ncbi:MAG: isoprenoid biosynthesis glyoxalase ElbB [Bacteroidales bacterium]|nr:isoprenoid biosynthesis glyoxalase ElbB [Bacteroidales bacterium]